MALQIHYFIYSLKKKQQHEHTWRRVCEQTSQNLRSSAPRWRPVTGSLVWCPCGSPSWSDNSWGHPPAPWCTSTVHKPQSIKHAFNFDSASSHQMFSKIKEGSWTSTCLWNWYTPYMEFIIHWIKLYMFKFVMSTARLIAKYTFHKSIFCRLTVALLSSGKLPQRCSSLYSSPRGANSRMRYTRDESWKYP